MALNFTVPAFFLDPDETTGACYAGCVEVGACNPPLPLPKPPWEDVPAWDDDTMASVAVQVLDQQRAEAFCAWRGGRLPSLGELARATHADTLAALNPALHELWLRCVSAPERPECTELPERVYGWPLPIRSWSLDKGPFGHNDLAASAVELTMTRQPATVEERDALCGLPAGAKDPRTLGSGHHAGYFPGLALLGVPEGYDLPWLVTGSGAEDGAVYGGARCAYDPAP